MYWDSERDLIVSILTREAVGGKHSKDLFSPSERQVGRRNNCDGQVLGDYDQIGRRPILDFEYPEVREYRVLSSTHATFHFSRAQYLPRADIDLGLGVLSAGAVIRRKTKSIRDVSSFLHCRESDRCTRSNQG